MEIDRYTKRVNGVQIVVPDFLDWIKWRLIINKITTLEEFEIYYDLLDMLDAHIALNLRDEAEEKVMKEAQQK